MARLTVDGQSKEFHERVKEIAFQHNWDNPPRGCVGYWCEWCYFSNSSKAYFQVDHLLPASRMEEFGLSIDKLTDIANAVVLCKACNASKLNFEYPRYGVGLAYRAPNLNMTHGGLRAPPLDWESLVQMASRKGRFKARG